MALDYLLAATTWLLLLTALLSVLGNGIILLTVIKNPQLRKRDCLYLISSLAVADFLTAWGNVPYAVDLLSKIAESCAQLGLVVLFFQNLAGARMNQIITLFLGLDRLYAVFEPVKYRTKNQLKVAQLVAAASFILGFVDAGTYLLQQHQQQQQYDANSSNCSAVVSKASSNFSLQTFRIFSNLIINIVTLLVHIIMYWKLRKMTLDNMNEESKSHFRQANETITLILLASLALVTIPCIVQVIDYLNGYKFFQKYSNILSIGNCLNGAANVGFYAWKHKDFHQEMKALFECSINKIRDSSGPGHVAVVAGVLNDHDRVPRPLGGHLDVPRHPIGANEDHLMVSM